MADSSYIHLGLKYGLNPAQAQTKIKDLPAIANDINKAKAIYPDAYGFLTFKGWSADKFLNLSCGSAAAVDAVYSGQYQQWGLACMSRVNIDWPEGDYYMTTYAPFAMGQYRGQGPHTGWNPRQAATTLHVWKQQWQESDPHQMAAMRSTNFGITSGGEAWVHGGSIDMMGFTGNNSGFYDPRYTESGLVLWDMGEASSVGRIWCSDWNGYGLEVIRGTPFTANSVISSFTNALGAVGIMDGELGTFNFGTISGDDDAALVVFDSKYGRGAGGNVNIAMLKSESGKRVPNKGQIAVWQKSPCVGTVNIGIVQGDQNDLFNDAAFVMNSRAWGQTLNVGGFVGWNFRTYVHDIQNQKRWAGTAYNPMVFTWASRNGGTFTDHVLGQQVAGTPVNATDRLGVVPNNGTFDYTNGTPKYSITGGVTPPTPVVCTGWTTGPWSAWGPCVGGQQTRTRTVTPSPAGCTGTPPNRPVESETQACSVTPPVGQELSKSGWVASATAIHTSGYEGPDKAIDGNPTTRYTSGRAQAAGDNLTITLPTSTSMSRIVFDCQGDYPGTYRIEARIGTNTAWTRLTPTTNPAGAPVMEVSFAKRNVKAYRLVVVAPRPVWLSCQETSAFA